MKHVVAFAGALLALGGGHPAPASPAARNSIHAVQIAGEEGLADCETSTLSVLVGRASGGARARFADPSWHGDCIGSTANGCAALHRARPERTLAAPGANDMANHILWSKS
jgi:hypothetical protein